ncbi:MULTISPECIES: tRNA-uridine aminocarboxypropyltransferase [Vibrio]|uniref:tRNA-uridine aminocarboxypropyltransferase n=1 Tax=Vibrio TaxID=662 RepID=UPI000C162EF6|nr:MULTISPECIES: DTW domain-containing protein [Vibrio]NAW68201.1 DTW domain-containing protein [Vibrio sp. V28_P6S34P95]NAX05587.1 DTW domain-containing protein [Vibrio sp. V30_P3S12P165]NAX33199.1 DTW domain-containing protein [Vibrio sp. V29_P1S30P107]NAX38804.1 DTW domain-containing protein [Vibrio sp. V27_P1S3P104]NAX41801.1 DTW domain-containing protein [Vibrio sp. V26_P1S5P106]
MSRYCSRCGKARKACICAGIVPLDSTVELIILQHPTEQHRPMGTARILTLSLANCRLWIGEDFRHHPELNALLAEPDVIHQVLYPCEHSICVSDSEPSIEQKVRVILLDGTWRKVFKMWQINTQLHHLPCLHLPETLKGNYRIRKAPNDNALSTVEAGFHLLQLWQPKQDFSPLLTCFEAMIDHQINQMPKGVFEQHYGSRSSR